MCGIGGWFAWDKQKHPKVSVIHSLLRANQLRGSDASGVAYLKEGEPYLRKAPITASRLIETVSADDWNLISHSPIGLIHTRAQTKGSPKNNKNNHPVNGFGWLVVHNGSVMNDDDLFEYYKDERFAEVDTSAIPLVLSKGATLETQIQHMTTLGGAATFAAWEIASPRKIILARFGHNDLYLFLDKENNILYFSSAAIFAKSLPAYSLGSLRFLTLHKIADDKVVVLDLDNPVRTFKVTRRPFYHIGPKKVERATGKTGVSSAVGDSKPVISKAEDKYVVLKTVADRNYQMMWWPGNEPTKPLSDLTHVTYNPMILVAEESKCRMPGSPYVLLTAYGRWKFRKTERCVERDFRPRKAIRKWWKSHLKVKHLYLPVDITGNSHVCDGKQLAETFIVHLKTDNGTEVQMPGYMCPWCGVTNRVPSWVGEKYRCEFCKIASWPNTGAK